jgi:hypothetical protein
VDKPTMLNVRSFAEGFQPSRTVSQPVNILTKNNGLIQKTFLGQWESCDQMLKTNAVEEKTVNNFFLDPTKENDFGHSLKGFIQIEKRGTYEFQTTSDDGSRLLINGFPIVNNDGLHSRKTVSGDIPLKAGLHEIEVHFFERGGQESLEVKWKGPDFDWRRIPAFRLFKTSD